MIENARWVGSRNAFRKTRRQIQTKRGSPRVSAIWSENVNGINEIGEREDAITFLFNWDSLRETNMNSR